MKTTKSILKALAIAATITLSSSAVMVHADHNPKGPWYATEDGLLHGKVTKSPIDRHAVWTMWFDQKGDRLSGNPGVTGSSPGVERKISTRTMVNPQMEGVVLEFDFIRETKTYDHSKDRGDSA